MTVCNNITVVSHIKNNSLFTNNGDWMWYNGNGQNYAESRVKTKTAIPQQQFSSRVHALQDVFFHFVSTLMLTSQLTEPDDTAKALKGKKNFAS